MKTDASVPLSGRPLAGPAMKAALFFSAGILAAAQHPVHPAVYAVTLGLCLILLLFLPGKDARGDVPAAGVLLAAGALALTIQHSFLTPLSVPDSLKSGEITVRGEVYGDTRFRHGNTYFTLRCRSLAGNGSEFRKSGLLPCVVYGKSIPLTRGAELRLTGKVRKIPHSAAEESLIRSPG
ncbi:MAG: DUF4131 domain-containing protein, partial [Candidatus Latescibacterota bacterium]